MKSILTTHAIFISQKCGVKLTTLSFKVSYLRSYYVECQTRRKKYMNDEHLLPHYKNSSHENLFLSVDDPISCTYVINVSNSLATSR